MIQHTRRRWGLGLAASLLILGLAAPLLVHSVVAAVPGHAVMGKTAQVTIQNFSFSPQSLTVAPGTTVVWTQKDSVAHTVTSDGNAWPDSGDLQQGKTFSFTFSKPGTYTYHCSIHPSMTGTIIVSAGASSSSGGMSGGTNAGMGMMMNMGPTSKRPMTVFTGWYDDQQVLYVSTDTSSKAEAMSEHINYAPALAKSLKTADTIYLVTNGHFATRGPVFDSQPGESDYTPLWQEVMVTWKDASTAVALGKDDQITALAKAGKLTLMKTGVVLNCPIVKVMASAPSSSSSSSSSGY